MAKLTKQQWSDARDLWQQDKSLSLRGLALQLGLSKNAVVKKAKAESWVKVSSVKVSTEKAVTPKKVSSKKVSTESKPVKKITPKFRNPSNLKILSAGLRVAPEGRSSKYSPDYNDLVFDLTLLGKNNKEIAGLLGIDESTLYDWCKAYPKFAKALNEGRDIADSQVARSLFERAVGYEVESEKIFNNNGEIIRVKTTEKYPPESGAAKLWLTNRQPKLWRDKIEVDHANDLDPETVHYLSTVFEQRLRESREMMRKMYEERKKGGFCLDVEYTRE